MPSGNQPSGWLGSLLVKVTQRNFKEGPRRECPRGGLPVLPRAPRASCHSLVPSTVTQLTLLTGIRAAAAGAMGESQPYDCSGLAHLWSQECEALWPSFLSAHKVSCHRTVSVLEVNSLMS